MEPEAPEAPLQLAQLWETKRSLRSRARSEGKLLLWCTEASKGIPSMKAIKLNFEVLEAALRWWISMNDEPKTFPIDAMREEAPGLLNWCFHV